MIQLILHLLGDYFLQNEWIATNKGKFSEQGWLACGIHCILYAIPFGVYYHNPYVMAAVMLSHFLVDKFALATYWTRLVNWNWSKSYFLGFDNTTPQYLSVWLTIIRDNSIHIAGNYFIISYFTS